MKKEYAIRWQRKDYGNLIKAVNRYNKRIQELEKMDLAVDLPEIINYNDIKKDIYTRSDLNKTISALNRIRFKNAFDILRLENGMLLSRFQYNDLMKKQKRGLDYLEGRLQEEKERYANIKNREITNDTMKQLEASIRSIKNWQTKTDYQAFTYALERLNKYGALNYERGRAETFRNNFMDLYDENFKGYVGYRKFRKVLKNIKDPKEFYEFIKQSDFLNDAFKIFYKSPSGGYQYGMYDSNEQAFVDALTNVYNIEI